MFLINFLVEGFLQTRNNDSLDENTIKEADDDDVEQY